MLSGILKNELAIAGVGILAVVLAGLMITATPCNTLRNNNNVVKSLENALAIVLTV
ncbi:MAG TPA: hypothetical protein VFZ67_01060 [Nitrososphaera sp.]